MHSGKYAINVSVAFVAITRVLGFTYAIWQSVNILSLFLYSTSCGGNAIDIHVYNWQPDVKKVAVPPSGKGR
jgi:hypothetical protein